MSKTGTRTHWYVFLAQVLILSVLALRSWYQDATLYETGPASQVERRDDLPGSLTFQSVGESGRVRASANRCLGAGDRLWTVGSDPRAEPTTRAATGPLDASPRFGIRSLDDRLVRMLPQWTVTVRVRRYGDEMLEVETFNCAFSTLQAGSYRVEATEDGPSTLVAFRAGKSRVSGGGDTYAVNPGKSARPGTDHPETALKTLQISVKTREEVKSRVVDFDVVGR